MVESVSGTIFNSFFRQTSLSTPLDVTLALSVRHIILNHCFCLYVDAAARGLRLRWCQFSSTRTVRVYSFKVEACRARWLHTTQLGTGRHRHRQVHGRLPYHYLHRHCQT
jgi:hypothetical protein